MHDHEKYLKIEIPKRFYSDSAGEPFKQCQVCGRSLHAPGVTYVVEKAMKNYPGYDFCSTVYELAICLDCHQKVQQGMSEESVKNLQLYYQSVMEKKGQHQVFIDMRTFNLDDWFSTCFFKGSEISKMSEYQMVAQFEGDKMLMTTPPLIIGSEAMNEMSSLLSDKTIDDMNDFRNRFMGPSPEIEELIYGKKLLLL